MHEILAFLDVNAGKRIRILGTDEPTETSPSPRTSLRNTESMANPI